MPPREGRIALARGLTVRETGTSINEQPVCEFRLLVVPDGHPPGHDDDPVDGGHPRGRGPRPATGTVVVMHDGAPGSPAAVWQRAHAQG